MTDDFNMYGDEPETDDQPKPLGPMAMLARKVDRLEAELATAREEIALLRRQLDGSLRGVNQLRTKLSLAGTNLDNLRKMR